MRILSGLLVRAALPAISLTCSGLFSLSAGAEPAISNIKSTPDIVIYEGTYPGWPWICTGFGWNAVLRLSRGHGARLLPHRNIYAFHKPGSWAKLVLGPLGD